MNKKIHIIVILTFVFLINNFSLAYASKDFDLWLIDFKETAIKNEQNDTHLRNINFCFFNK